ncbi:hypothetical protein HGA13_08275 [Nocardia speluncae]|uniref:Uncharacterized protein n=1 Tax=Nocardia speluncae TaxID=419477 RepID=A0A846XCD6_9NOCA|nr:hypothetical protein [Nocardia speluncae]NKY33065.1 hypothetical protein [Nocardia speluncae]
MPSSSKANSTGRTAATGTGESAPDKTAAPREKPDSRPAATETAPAATLTLPFLDARVAIPEKGIMMKAGPVELSLPTRYLYYGGIGALAVVGAVEWPIAGALAATGLIIGRLRKSAPEPETVGATASAT